jgi:hypothetical protein
MIGFALTSVLSQRERKGKGRNAVLMKLRIIRLALSAMLFALCFPAEAQQPKKVWRIGYLSSLSPSSESTVPRQFGWLCASVAT